MKIHRLPNAKMKPPESRARFLSIAGRILVVESYRSGREWVMRPPRPATPDEIRFANVAKLHAEDWDHQEPQMFAKYAKS